MANIMKLIYINHFERKTLWRTNRICKTALRELWSFTAKMGIYSGSEYMPGGLR